GNSVAIFDDYPVLGYAVTNGQPFKLVGEPEKGSSYGFAVKKGENKELLKKFNQGLKDLNFLDVNFAIDFRKKKNYTDTGYHRFHYLCSFSFSG
ncbi:type 2 periplasmic-binding domain-containing protein, partial [Parabacteroides distasonis]